MTLFETFSANRKRRERKRRRNRILVVTGALVLTVLLLLGINNPEFVESQLLALPEKISGIFFLAKRGETVPETQVVFLAKTNTPTQPMTATPELPENTATNLPVVVISKTPYPVVRILTGLPEGTVYMRKGPSTSFPVIRVLSEGEKMVFIACVFGWAQVELDEQTGFVYAKYTNKNCENAK